MTPAVHVVLPDTQSKPGVPVIHLHWIGRYIVEQFGGRDNVKIIHLGDHWDMPSLSSYDKGKKRMEGMRYLDDVDAGNASWRHLNDPLDLFNSIGARRVRGRKESRKAGSHHTRIAPLWKPEKYLLRGNHEDRITRATEDDAQLAGLLTLDHLKSPGWTVVDFLEPLFLDGIGYAHFWANPMTGKPLGGQAATRLKTVGHSFTMGHQQTLDYALRFVRGRSQHALIAGACYLHNEEYKGPQGNAHWRGIIVCHQVEEGSYDPMFVSLDYLCRRYQGVRLAEFMAEKFYLTAG